ncbi:MAG: hypothetical protein HY268_22155 [Deltaproteobacteria bacterium]|nr:hypothetical protein [Deltaproteobacteria bacterium]
MKATAIGLLVVSAYWIEQGIVALSKDTWQGVEGIALGVLLLPLAKYLWGRDLGGSTSSKR